MTKGTHFHFLPFYVHHHPVKRQINANFIAAALVTPQELLLYRIKFYDISVTVGLVNIYGGFGAGCFPYSLFWH